MLDYGFYFPSGLEQLSGNRLDTSFQDQFFKTFCTSRSEANSPRSASSIPFLISSICQVDSASFIFPAPRPQQLRDLRVLAFQGPAERGGVELLVAQSRVRAMLEQELDLRLWPVVGRQVQPRSAKEAAPIDVRALLQQKPRDLHVAVAGRDVQRLGDQFRVALRRRGFFPLAIAQVARARLPRAGLQRGG